MGAHSHKERAHAVWAPSASGRWLACPASVNDPNTVGKSAHIFWAEPWPEDPDNYHTARGTAIHEEADRTLTQALKTGRFAMRGGVLTFTNPENGQKTHLPQEEWQAHVRNFVQGALRIYDELRAEHGAESVEIINERRVNIWGDECWGSTDCAVIAPGVLHVIDLKAGHGLVDSDSDQNKCYATGLFDYAAHRGVRVKRVFLHIAQVANDDEGGWSTTEVTPKDLRAHKDRITDAIALSRAAKSSGILPTERNINPYCNFCPRFTICPAHHDRALRALEAADLDTGEVVFDAAGLTTEKLVALYGLAGPLRDLFSAVEAELLTRTEHGQDTGFKIVEGRANRRWNPEKTEDEIAAELAELAAFMGVEYDPHEKKLKSFTAAEAAFGKGAVDALVVKPPGKPTLARVNDPRPLLDNLAVLKD